MGIVWGVSFGFSLHSLLESYFLVFHIIECDSGAKQLVTCTNFDIDQGEVSKQLNPLSQTVSR